MSFDTLIRYLTLCPLSDCFGRKVRRHHLTFSKAQSLVLKMVEKNRQEPVNLRFPSNNLEVVTEDIECHDNDLQSQSVGENSMQAQAALNRFPSSQQTGGDFLDDMKEDSDNDEDVSPQEIPNNGQQHQIFVT